MRKNIYFSLLFVLSSLSILAQDAKLIVEISNDTLLIGNYIQVKFTLENFGGQFEMPELDGLRVISGPNTSSSMSMINGEIEQSSSYAFYLEPLDVGISTIGSSYIVTEQGTLESQPITLFVQSNPDGVQLNPQNLIIVEEVTLGKDGQLKNKMKGKKRFKI